MAVAELEEGHMDECEACGGHLERVCPRCRNVEEWLRDQPTRNNIGLQLRRRCVQGAQLGFGLGIGLVFGLGFSLASMRMLNASITGLSYLVKGVGDLNERITDRLNGYARCY
jgi:phage FluMu protein Com